jgi:hypothetical protein
MTRHSKIDHLETALRGFVDKKDVFRLQIPMHDSFFMKVVHRRNDLRHYFCSLFLAEEFVFLDPVEKLSSLKILTNQIVVDLVLVEFI